MDRPKLDVRRNEARKSGAGDPRYFTGQVRQEPLIEAPAPARMRAVLVTFEPGARTNWHTHPLGQTLVVVSGLGRAQLRGGAVEVLNPGDVVWFPPGVEHWHGASPGAAMAHLAIHEALDGKHVDWLEPVADSDYGT